MQEGYMQVVGILVLLGSVVSDAVHDLEVVIEVTRTLDEVYRIRDYESHGKALRNTTAQTLCHAHNERLAVVDKALFKKVVGISHLLKGENELVWIKGFDATCEIYKLIDSEFKKRLTSCWGRKRRFLCKNDNTTGHTPVYGNETQCKDGGDPVIPSGNERRHDDGEFWGEKITNNENAPKCAVLNITSGEAERRNCTNNGQRVLCLKTTDGKTKRLWIAIVISVGSFVVGVIFAGIICRCIYRRKETKSSKHRGRKKKKKIKANGEDSGAYAEIMEVDTFDHISRPVYDHTSRNPLNRKSPLDTSLYDKPLHFPYTQPVDLISDTKGDYAEPYQHLGTLEKDSIPPSPSKKSVPGYKGRPRKEYKIRAPEVPPPGIPTRSERKALENSTGGGEYADPIETCHINVTDSNTKV